MHAVFKIQTIPITFHLIVHFLSLEEVAVMGFEVNRMGAVHVVNVLKNSVN
jgi:hypothetical protein